MGRKGVRKFLNAPPKRHRHYGPTKTVRVRKPSVEVPTESVGDAGCAMDFNGFEVGITRDLPMARVISMFDGIGAGRVVLQRLKIAVEKYWSLEVDEQCIRILNENFDDVIHLGSVTEFDCEAVSNIGCCHILLGEVGMINFSKGGSPCGDISRQVTIQSQQLVNPNRKGLEDVSGQSHLFYDYVRVRNQLSAAAQAQGRNFFWLFENTSHLETKVKAAMSEALGCRPIERCATKYSATKRKRLFWSNIPGVYEGREKNERRRLLQEYLGHVRTAMVPVAKTFTTNRAAQKNAMGCLPVSYQGKPEGLFARDLEVLLGFPAGFTDYGGMSNTARSKLLGRSWSVDVVMALLAPLKDFFRPEE
ncbi:DNA (cytosine-5)-methyltransferase 3C-like [Frankliniella occidentalis]|uniref:DNA (cytosine-5-)-methyltransferase n=1 Tax=Frankliniella occidentalis TaxID=133901 RepID=A0A9C6XU08_FRAOC|nr:DNA (cytosine-5)-methyltransferase 3C-like [Frankliniella occidentalis]